MQGVRGCPLKIEILFKQKGTLITPTILYNMDSCLTSYEEKTKDELIAIIESLKQKLLEQQINHINVLQELHFDAVKNDANKMP